MILPENTRYLPALDLKIKTAFKHILENTREINVSSILHPSKLFLLMKIMGNFGPKTSDDCLACHVRGSWCPAPFHPKSLRWKCFSLVLLLFQNPLLWRFCLLLYWPYSEHTTFNHTLLFIFFLQTPSAEVSAKQLLLPVVREVIGTHPHKGISDEFIICYYCAKKQ